MGRNFSGVKGGEVISEELTRPKIIGIERLDYHINITQSVKS